MKDRRQKSKGRSDAGAGLVPSRQPVVRSQETNREEGFDQFKRANAAALGLLSLCDRTKKDLKDRLLKKGYAAEVINRVIRGLESEGYINDELFAFKFTYDAVMRKCLGPGIVRQGLQEKGISREIIDDAVRRIFQDNDEKSIARKAVMKIHLRFGALLSGGKEKGKMAETRLKEIKRLSDYLRRRGFSYDIIGETIREIEKENDV